MNTNSSSSSSGNVPPASDDKDDILTDGLGASDAAAADAAVALKKFLLPPISPMKPEKGLRRTGHVIRGKASAAAEKKKDVPRFRLGYDFASRLKGLPEPWVGRGHGGVDDVIALIVFKRTYQRKGESYAGMIIRVVEGVYNIMLRHFTAARLPWSYKKAQASARKMAQLMFDMKFLPPGRGLWAMGTAIIEERNLNAALQNCAFVSTKHIDRHPTDAFEFCMDLSMLGVGVGFDTVGATKKARVYMPIGANLEHPEEYDIYVIDDSRTGWVDSTKALIQSYMYPGRKAVQFDYSDIRAAGTPLQGFGGVSSGPKPLMQLHQMLRELLHRYATEHRRADSYFITSVMNMIAVCVVSGNIRRSALIAFGEPGDSVFLDLKNYSKYPERAAIGWTSNNSVLTTTGSDYAKIVEGILSNGEPGIAWIDNMRAYGRMCEPPNYRDIKAAGGNPCLEQTLWHKEMCTLVETFIANHLSYEEYEETLKFAFLYAKAVTLAPTHIEESNRVMSKNRRIGTSMTGITQFIATNKGGIGELRRWCDTGYKYLCEFDRHLSNIFGVRESIKKTSVKPSGTVSLLQGATPGMHFPIAQHYIRRIRLSSTNEIVKELADANYSIEPAILCKSLEDPTKYVYDDNTVVVSIPWSLGPLVTKTEQNVSMWEQLELASFLQAYWADNQVSCTVKFDPVTEGPHLKSAIEFYQYRLKGISFLPKGELFDYPQLPYEPISYERFLELNSKLRPLNSGGAAAAAAAAVLQQQQQQAISAPVAAAPAAAGDTDDDDTSMDVPDELSFCESDHCEISAMKSTWNQKTTAPQKQQQDDDGK